MDLNPNSKPQQNPDYRLELLDGELLLYHLNDTRILYCNQTASLIWRLCNGDHTITQITTLLSEAYPESKETLPDEVAATLREFLTHGAISLL